MVTINYPIILEKIFEKLKSYNIKPVIIGGYIRDSLLKIDSKDIDIELYNVENIDLLEDILKQFGSVNEVGKSFSVIKLNIEDLDLDFSLPRIDSKVAVGHRGFKITTDSHLDFTTATSRRDFTINAIGYDVTEKKLLDPFGGIEDLKNKILRAVNLKKFGEDPLRVLRAVQFATRFSLAIDQKLLALCHTMIHRDQLSYLSHERIFTEIEKLLLKSTEPSKGIFLLKKMELFEIFKELKTLTADELEYTAALLDRYQKIKTVPDQKHNMIVMLTLLTSKMQTKIYTTFLMHLTNDKEILHKIQNIHTYLENPTYTLAMRLDLIVLEEYLKTIGEKGYKKFVENVEPKIKGRDLINQGMQPSQKFSKILEEKYQEQVKNSI